MDVFSDASAYFRRHVIIYIFKDIPELTLCYVSRSIGINNELDKKGSIPDEARDFSLGHSVQVCSRPHPASSLRCTGGSLPGVRWPRHEADPSAPSGAGLRKPGALFPLPQTQADTEIH
jgi:hypothetical protein